MSREPELPNLRHLQVFCAVARAASLSAAAAELPLSQPAMTQAIAGLEAYFGATLFRRRNSGMQLTAVGAQCLVRAERALTQLAAGTAEIDPPVRARRQHLWPAAVLSAAQLLALKAIVEHGGFSAAARG